jgi:hypothetical protein
MEYTNILYAMYAAIIGLVILSLVHAHLNGGFWAEMTNVRKDLVETVQGQVDLPGDIFPAKGTPMVSAVIFCALMVVVCTCTCVLTYQLEQGFATFWFNFPFAQIAEVKELDSRM